MMYHGINHSLIGFGVVKISLLKAARKKEPEFGCFIVVVACGFDVGAKSIWKHALRINILEKNRKERMVSGLRVLDIEEEERDSTRHEHEGRPF
jgi:hypothetical protein